MALFILGILSLAFGAGAGSLFGANQVSENISRETVQALINISNSASQNCEISAGQVQSANISNNKDININLTENWDQYLLLNTNCIQNVTFQNDISQAISQEVDQLAKNISQQFQLNTSASKNVSEQVANLSIQVSNAFTQNCNGFESQTQDFNLVNNETVNATVYQNWKQYNSSTFNCVMKDKAVNETAQQLNQTVNQQAETTVQNFFAVIFGSIFAIIAIIGLIIFSLIFFGIIGRPNTTVVRNVSSPNLNNLDTNSLKLLSESLNTPVATPVISSSVPGKVTTTATAPITKVTPVTTTATPSVTKVTPVTTTATTPSVTKVATPSVTTPSVTKVTTSVPKTTEKIALAKP